MIDERPLLSIRRDYSRPESHAIERFRDAATVHLIDAMNGRGALGYEIKPVNPKAATFVGTALPCDAGPDDTLAILAALELARPGDVLVAATDAYKGSAVVGDLFAAMAVTAGLQAIVTDGLARDTDGIIETGLPVFAAGVSPNSAARSGPGTVGLPITVSNLDIAPGDIVVGDRDGVVIVPQHQLDQVQEQLDHVRAAEASYPTGPSGEVHVPDSIRALLSSDRVRYVANT